MSGSVWTVLVAGGTGERFGRPKQFQALAGRRVLDWCLDPARAVSEGVVLVVPPESGGLAVPGVDAVVPGGVTRSGSVRAGIAAVPTEVEIIVVHDAARPLATIELFGEVIAAVENGADAAIPGLAVTDTLKRVDGEAVTATVDRRDLVAVQTPQAFLATALRAVHQDEPESTDDAALVEAAGGRVVVVPGDTTNIKITWPDDLTTARAILEARGSNGTAPAP